MKTSPHNPGMSGCRTALLRIAVVAGFLIAAAAARTQDGVTRVGDDDYLTGGEISAIRDAQQPDKRLILYMDFAQRRIDTMKQALASNKSGAGRSVQKTLVEYIRVLEALQSTLEDARERRAPMEKAIKDIELRGGEFLRYLESIDESAPGFADFEYTIEEALDMTRDELNEVARGAFPEIQERTPPRELPGLPSSRQPSRPDARPSPPPLPEDGPPRKSGSSSGQTSSEPAEEEEGPPRKSQQPRQ